MKKKKNSFRDKLWKIVGVGVCIFTILMIVSDVLEVGERLRRTSQYLEYGFYVLSAILFYVLLLNPIRIILFSPSFSVVTVLDEDNERNLKTYKRIVKTLESNNEIDEDTKKRLANCETSGELRDELSVVFNTTIKKEINRIIMNNAKTVMISTAISQNGKFDMYAVLTCNVKMIKDIVVKCGFRPSYPKLGKLSLNVITTALVAEGLEGLNFNDIFPQSTTNALANIPFIKPIAASIVDGISNALLTIRIGVITRKYLFTEGEFDKSKIRVEAIKESLKMIPNVVKEVINFFPSKISNLFVKKEESESQ